jgi:hypothetical protein
VNILFITSIAVVAPDPTRSRTLFVDALGLPLEASPGSDYFHSERIEGSKHFGVWPLAEAAQACFGSAEWPARRPAPQVSIEFEVESAYARASVSSTRFRSARPVARLPAASANIAAAVRASQTIPSRARCGRASLAST